MQAAVLILGARGRFGLAAARAFADAGWRVIAHMRPGAQVPAEVFGDARIQWLAHEVGQTEALSALARGASVVVHALNPAYTNKAWRAQALPMLGASIEVARALGATLMLPGNVYNFGQQMPAVLREDTPQRASTVKGQIRIGMEEQLRRSGVRSIVIRAGDFFGSGQGTWFDQVIMKDIRKAVLTYPGPREVATAWAYLPDLARTFVAVAQRRTRLAPFAVLHFRGHVASAQQWLDALQPLAQTQGWTAPAGEVRFKRLPWPLLRMAGWVVPTLASLVEMRYLWETPHTLANDRLRELIGEEPHTPLPQALQCALEGLGYLDASAAQEDHRAAA